MDQQKKIKQVSPPFAVLPRLDRLDRLLQNLEERRTCLSTRQSSKCSSLSFTSVEQYKTLSTAVEEVSYKGSLMERLAALENRVLQLSIELDFGSTSRSSSSTTIPISPERKVPANKELDGTMKMATEKEQNPLIIAQERESCSIKACHTKQSPKGRGRKPAVIITDRFTRKKLLGWFQMGC